MSQEGFTLYPTPGSGATRMAWIRRCVSKSPEWCTTSGSDEAYDVGFKGGVFQSKALDLKLHANGALKEFRFETKQRGGEGLKSAADATAAVTDALKEVRSAREAAEKD